MGAEEQDCTRGEGRAHTAPGHGAGATPAAGAAAAADRGRGCRGGQAATARRAGSECCRFCRVQSLFTQRGDRPPPGPAERGQRASSRAACAAPSREAPVQGVRGGAGPLPAPARQEHMQGVRGGICPVERT